ncbi:MAG: hypothetical protein LBK44_03540 [Spirochaetales bacterium]|jgi:hypothetical protein|nr:hypothetical protein [Spirochaetales bacterium]
MRKRNDVLRFLYLNIYSFLIACAGILTLIVPFYRISRWTLIIQAIVAIKLFMIAGKLLFTWKDKKLKMEILKTRNRDKFRPDTFGIFMQAPCGRLIVHQVLMDLHKHKEYKSLLKLRKPLLERLRNNCTPVKTVIYITEDYR